MMAKSDGASVEKDKVPGRNRDELVIRPSDNRGRRREEDFPLRRANPHAFAVNDARRLRREGKLRRRGRDDDQRRSRRGGPGEGQGALQRGYIGPGSQGHCRGRRAYQKVVCARPSHVLTGYLRGEPRDSQCSRSGS